mmetsp:Transcript_58100/g.136009  ORF Transcript_58100/g.136009 Transcript_58100/m.136009 type:complete len:201 (+) Transcript_58100:641-1243(+)
MKQDHGNAKSDGHIDWRMHPEVKPPIHNEDAPDQDDAKHHLQGRRPPSIPIHGDAIPVACRACIEVENVQPHTDRIDRMSTGQTVFHIVRRRPITGAITDETNPFLPVWPWGANGVLHGISNIDAGGHERCQLSRQLQLASPKQKRQGSDVEDDSAGVGCQEVDPVQQRMPEPLNPNYPRASQLHLSHNPGSHLFANLLV